MEIISNDIAQQIVDTVHDVCDHNINFISEKGIIVASTDQERVGTYHEIGYRAALEGRTIEVTDDASYIGTRRGINIPVFYNDRIVAVIGISGDVEEIRKYAYLAQKITSILLKEREMDALGAQKKNRLNYVIRCLINQEPLAEQYLQDTLAENGLSGSSVCRTILVQLNARYNPNNLFMIQSAITQAFAQMEAHFYRYVYPNEYILIIEDQLFNRERHILKRLAQSYREVLSIGIGRPSPVVRSDQSFLCARAAIACASPDNNLILYDDLDYELLLSGISKEIQEQYCEKVLRDLSKEDQQVLNVYFAQDMSLQGTAAVLFMHKNSLQYRLNHIAGVTGYNPRKFRDAAVLYSALQLTARSHPDLPG
jgi:carbohydrate diacid regulator